MTVHPWRGVLHDRGSDAWPVLAASTAAIGALLAVPLPWWALVATVATAVLWRRPLSWCLLLLVLTDLLAVRSLEGLHPPPDAPFAGSILLVTDPEPTSSGALRFEAATEHGRLLTDVRSPTASEALSSLLAGDRVDVRGVTGSLRGPTDWTRSRHLAGTLRVESVGKAAPAAPHHAASNGYREVLDRGASSLSATQRSLLAGLVLGDDRAQPPQLTADFRAAGLTHLLAVSGQNVAFVLVVVGPVLRTMRLWPRFVLATMVIASFALVTRFEPSVLRASFVAVVALYAHTTGRSSGSVRHLALAVCGLFLVDPLLVYSLGFRLSVAASLGVIVLAPRIAARLPGPRWFREGLAVTAGAQCAVAPVLVPALGPMPVAALPANLLAGPVAGALMVWGLTAGTLAGVFGGRVAFVLHRPSAIGLDLLDRIAGVGASLPLGTVDLRDLAVVAAGVSIAVLVPRPALRVAAATVAVVALVAPALAPQRIGVRSAGWGATVWVDGPMAVVEVDVGANAADVVETLRSAEVRAVGLLVLRSSRPAVSAVVDAVADRFSVGAVIGPPGAPHPDVVVVPGGFRSRVGRFEVVVDVAGPPMRVRVGWRAPEGVSSSAPAVGSPGASGARRSTVRRAVPRRRRGPRRRRRRSRRGARAPTRRAGEQLVVGRCRTVRSCRRARRCRGLAPAVGLRGLACRQRRPLCRRLPAAGGVPDRRCRGRRPGRGVERRAE